MKSVASWWYPAALAGLLAAAVLFRSWGVVLGAPLDFWADEAWWAELIQQRSLAEFTLRPVGYLWLSQRLIEAGQPELMLRLPSYLAGVGTVVCVLLAATRLFRVRLVVVLVVCLVALHPKLIAFAKEFKPYSLETFVHAGFLLWGIACLQGRRVGASFYAAALAALPFCYNLVFLYPGLLAVAAATTPLGARMRRLSARQWTGVAVIACAAAVLAHFALAGWLDLASKRAVWGEKYGVFRVDDGWLAGIGWYARETWDLVVLPVAAPSAVKLLLGLAYFGGLVATAAQRRYALLCLLAAAPLMTALANLLGYWPYGAFRTNLFLFPALVLTMGQGLEWAASTRRLRYPVLGAVALMVVALLWVQPGYHRTKHAADWAPSPQLTAVLEDMQRRLRHDQAPVANVIIADWHSWRPLRYYLPDFAELAAASTLVRGPVTGLDALEALVVEAHAGARERAGPTRVWLVVTKLDRFRPILSSPQVADYKVYERHFATHDEAYHPILVELLVPGQGG